MVWTRSIDHKRRGLRDYAIGEGDPWNALPRRFHVCKLQLLNVLVHLMLNMEHRPGINFASLAVSLKLLSRFRGAIMCLGYGQLCGQWEI